MARLPEPDRFTIDEISARWTKLYGPEFTPGYIHRLAETGALEIEKEECTEYSDDINPASVRFGADLLAAHFDGRAKVRTDYWISQKERDRFEREHPAPSAPGARSGHPEYYSEKLVLLIQAAHEFWSSADRDDRTTHTTNDAVIEWLKGHGWGGDISKRAATIIRPAWAASGRPKK